MGTDQAPDCVSIMTIYRILLTMHVCVKKKERERERERERCVYACMSGVHTMITKKIT